MKTSKKNHRGAKPEIVRIKRNPIEVEFERIKRGPAESERSKRKPAESERVRRAVSFAPPRAVFERIERETEICADVSTPVKIKAAPMCFSLERAWLPGVTPRAPHPSAMIEQRREGVPPTDWRARLQELFPDNTINPQGRAWSTVDPETQRLVREASADVVPGELCADVSTPVKIKAAPMCFSPAEVAARFSVSRSVILSAIRKGELKAFKFSRSLYRVPRASVESWAGKCAVGPAAIV